MITTPMKMLFRRPSHSPTKLVVTAPMKHPISNWNRSGRPFAHVSCERLTIATMSAMRFAPLFVFGSAPYQKIFESCRIQRTYQYGRWYQRHHLRCSIFMSTSPALTGERCLPFTSPPISPLSKPINKNPRHARSDTVYNKAFPSRTTMMSLESTTLYRKALVGAFEGGKAGIYTETRLNNCRTHVTPIHSECGGRLQDHLCMPCVWSTNSHIWAGRTLSAAGCGNCRLKSQSMTASIT